MRYWTKCILEVKKGDWEREAILNSILNDGWGGKDMFHCAINVGQETFLETGVYDIIFAKETFQSESQDFVEIAEVSAIGQKLSGLDRSWFFWDEDNLGLRIILAWHQDSGAAWSSSKIFENKVARK